MTTEINNCRRVLSIQSHVVRGYVGNKSATFPLQVLGYEVDAINSVQFSNHTQYPHIGGQILKCGELKELVNGLRNNGLLCKYSHLLTGYIGDPSFLQETVAVVKELKALNPQLVYVCDPVMGDHGRFYTSETLLPVYRDEVLPVADIVVPNQFEIECLTGKKIASVCDAVNAMKVVHDKGPHTVIITSTELGDTDNLLMIASHRKGDGSFVRFQQKIPVQDAVFVGTGDLFAALLLAWSEKADIKEACSKVISTMQHVLTRTLKAAKELAGEGNKPNCMQLELQLIQSIRDIETPTTPVPSAEDI